MFSRRFSDIFNEPNMGIPLRKASWADKTRYQMVRNVDKFDD